MSQRWLDSFDDFLTDVGELPFPDCTLDRIDNNGHYEKGNVRWVDRKTQSNNRHDSVYVTQQGVTLTISQWADKFGFPANVLRYRLSAGWDFDRAVKTPRRVNKNYKRRR